MKTLAQTLIPTLNIDHPAHKEFGKLVGPVLDDVFVLDFWAKD
jgi:hypothetical protein